MSRSSYAIIGLHVVGGIIDPDYRGTVRILLENRGNDTQRVQPGERVAQIIIERYERVRLEDVRSASELTMTGRGGKGLGSTGMF